MKELPLLFITMEEKIIERLDLIIALISTRMRANYLDQNKPDQNYVQINQNNNQISEQKEPSLFQDKDLVLNISVTLDQIWRNQNLQYRVMHNVRPYAELVKAETGTEVTLEDVWNWLTRFKLERYFSNPTRFAQFKISRPERLADWCFNVIAEKSMGQYWMYDYLAYVNKVFAAQAPTPEAAPQREPGLSEFEYRVGDRRFYFDKKENCEYEIPEGAEPRPNDDSWLNTRSGLWVGV